MEATKEEEAPTSEQNPNPNSNPNSNPIPNPNLNPNPPRTTKGKSCKGCAYYSSVRKANSQNPVCYGLSRTLEQGHFLIVSLIFYFGLIFVYDSILLVEVENAKTLELKVCWWNFSNLLLNMLWCRCIICVFVFHFFFICGTKINCAWCKGNWKLNV